MPRVVSAGHWIAKPEKFFPFGRFAGSAGQLRSAVGDDLEAGADWIKVIADWAPNDEATFSTDELRSVVDQAHRRGKRVAAHAQGSGARNAVSAGVDTIEHGFHLDDGTIALMAGRTTLVATLQPLATFLDYGSYGGRFAERRPFVEATVEAARDSVRRAHRAGVRVATGTDFGGPNRSGYLAREVELLVSAGLKPHEALGAATWVGGEVLGVPHAGTLDEGAPADLVAIDGDPLSDPAALWRVAAVIRGGVRIS